MTYLEELENGIVKRHGCEARHLETDTVEVVIQGRGLWRGNVSTFALIRHPTAKRCYAWGNRTPEGGWEVVTALEIPPVASPETAVRAAVLAQLKSGGR